MMAVTNPITFGEVNKSKKWREEMSTEIETVEKNQTRELTVLPKGVKPIGVKWMFKTKRSEVIEIEKFKASLVTKGYAQRHGIDYTEVFAQVVRFDTICVILSMATQFSWKAFQLNVKSVFLHRELKKGVFVKKLEEFIKKGEKKRKSIS